MAGATMSMFFIDTLQFSEKMIESGMQPKTAKALAEEIKEISEQSVDGLATRQDLLAVKQDLLAVKQDLTGEINILKKEFNIVRHEIKIAMLTTIISIGVMIITSVGVINWLSKAVTGY